MLSLESQPAIVCAFFIFAATLYGLYSRRNRHRLPLPPGPKQLPLVGNLFDVPSTLQWETYMRWSKECDSDIIHFNLAGTSVIVLSSLEATYTLLEKRSAMYSDRSAWTMVKELMGWDFNIALMNYGDEWRTHRRLFNGAFNAKAALKYRPHELIGTHVLLERLLQSPQDFLKHFRQMAGEIIMSVAYGIDVRPTDDPYVALAHKAMHTFSVAAVPGLYLVDTFPILKHVPTWFPLAGFKRQAAEWRKLSRAMLEVPFAETKRQMESGVASPSFTSESLYALKESDDIYYQERHIKCTAGTMYIGGADTTVSALGTFMLGMLTNPAAQKTAQAEIDAVTGGKRLPSFEDEASLPYVSAMVKEALRWKNVTPFAVPRNLKTEDEYHGYRLPAGSIVIGNTWAILHDEALYPDPYAFKPERFLLDGKLNPAVKNPDSAFGFGRRLCPGRHMATSSIWITVASLLATFDIAKATDENGRVIEPSYEYLSGGINTPLPFKCSITPRSKDAAALIQRTVNEDRRA
ncbi:cytochrome P450 [Mycena pura]|uniref:Cytochrome P450 n=1 Tax=Mycena pura TaxID=153505 RepID=A0AAD6YKQ8_9AGAR|nr:cytochrome P450 [Mycena pura]